MNIDFDKIADAIYFRVKDGKVSKTIKLENRLIVDVDKNGSIIGFEMLEASTQLQKSDITDLLSGGKKSIPFQVLRA